jgi:sodium transport system permease protein
MRRRVVGTILLRELRDTLRDRRTLITMLVLPIVLYPALMIGFGKVGASRARSLLVEPAPVLLRVDGQAVLRDGGPDGEVAEALRAIEGFELQADRPDAERDLMEDRLVLIADLPQDLLERMEEGRPTRVMPLHRSARELSASALRRLESALQALSARRFPLEIARSEGDLSSATERGGQGFGGFLAMMVVFMAMAGAFYPAIDAAAGEKERGTLETLLLAPVSRAEIVAGKYLAVMVVGMAAGLMNLASMAFTFSALPSSLGFSASIAVSGRSFMVVAAGLGLVSALFSAVCLALSAFARTYKEGQAYMTPALVVVMPLAILATLPNMSLDLGTAMVPVTNLCLLVREFLAGRTPWREAAVTGLVLLALAGAALHLAVSLFRREEILFRDGGGGFRWFRDQDALRPARAPAGAAFLAFLLALPWLFHGGSRLLALGAVESLGIVLAGLAVLAAMVAWMSGAALRPSLGLLGAPPREWGRGLLLGPLLAGVSAGVGLAQAHVFGIAGSTSPAAGFLADAAARAPLPLLLAALALAPALGEEVLFRGLLLRSLCGVMKAVPAVLLSAFLFAALHLDAARFLPQFAAGLLLGILALRSGSVGPGIVAHLLHNGTLIVLARSGRESIAEVPSVVALTAALALLVALVPGRGRP